MHGLSGETINRGTINIYLHIGLLSWDREKRYIGGHGKSKDNKLVNTENQRTVINGEHGKLQDSKLVNTENRRTVNRGTILGQVSVGNFSAETFLNDL